MNAAVFHTVAPRQIFNRSVIAGSKDFINLMGNWVLLAMITCGKIALKPKSVDTDAKSVIRDLWVLKDARTAPRYRSQNSTSAPFHVRSQRTFIHVDQNIVWRDAVGPPVKRIGLACKLQNKIASKAGPKKGVPKMNPKKGPPYLPEPWGPQIGVPELLSKLGTKPTQPDQFHAFSCNTWIGKEAVTGKVPMRPFQAFRKRLKYVRWDGGPPWKGKHRRFSTASGRPSGTKSKACLTNCCLLGATPYSTF